MWRFRRLNRYIGIVRTEPVLLVLGLATLIACGARPLAESSAPKEPGKSDAELQQVNVSRLYDQSCGHCHGVRGEGGGAGTKTLLTADKFDQKWDKPFFDAIKNGVKDMGMEPFGQTLSDPEIWGLVVHIRELQAAALRAETGSPKPTNGVYKAKGHNFKIETIIDRGAGLTTPWAVDWLKDGRMLVTNRPGKMMLFDKGKLTEVEGIPPSVEIGQGGLMDVAVHRDGPKGPGGKEWVYLALTDPAVSPQRGGITKIVRGTLGFKDGKASWENNQTIFQCAPNTYNGSGVHFGSRIVFDGKGKIYFAIGERGNGDLAQNLSRPNGKIYRVNEDGTVPSDNPFVGKEVNGMKAIGAVWSYGHRNPQGLVMDLNGVLWDTEHGPRGGDEINRIQKGANYGWPIVAFSINYNDSPYRIPWPTADQKFVMPVFRWLPSIGACGLDVVRGPGFPKWKGDLIAGGLSGQNVDRIRIKDDKVVEREELIQGMGRVRDVVYGVDGNIYVVLNQPDIVIRLVPVN